jgi:glycosyltransferase involved in cell wall biosynthesis
MKIDLLYFTDSFDETVNWELGEKRLMTRDISRLKVLIDTYLKNSKADWIFFWDFRLGQIDTRLIEKLAATKIDAWHAGFKCQDQDILKLFSVVQPSWILNARINEEIESSSWKISLRCLLIRRNIFEHFDSIAITYSSIEMVSLDLGYRLYKNGVICRYHPDLVNNADVSKNAIFEDQILFIRKFFGKKWVFWCYLRCLLMNIYSGEVMRGLLSPKKIKSSKDKLVLRDINRDLGHKSRYNKKVSIIMPSLNRYLFTINTLEQLKAQSIEPLEIILTDQTDPPDRISLNDKFKDLPLKVFVQDTKGQCIAWNKLFSEAKGEYILILGDDYDGIENNFVEQFISVMEHFDADMVGSFVEEIGANNKRNPKGSIFMSDTLPIVLFKRELLYKSGGMDMAFNRTIRADGDLCMRFQLNGALMISDHNIYILHHRAPMGGLRTHKARVITNNMAKRSIFKYHFPTASEFYITLRYFDKFNYLNYRAMRTLSLFMMRGKIYQRISKIIFSAFLYPYLSKRVKRMASNAGEMMKEYPQIPVIHE